MRRVVPVERVPVLRIGGVEPARLVELLVLVVGVVS